MSVRGSRSCFVGELIHNPAILQFPYQVSGEFVCATGIQMGTVFEILVIMDVLRVIREINEGNIALLTNVFDCRQLHSTED